MEATGAKERLCVTGAGGYIASWLVKLLLSKDYVVHGTVRDPGNRKYTHLNKLDKAAENLKLFKAELLDYESLLAAVKECTGVFHIASPVPVSLSPTSDPESELIEPAVKGTQNVLKACLEANIKRVVVVSSTAAVFMNPNWPKDEPMDETCWSDMESCRPDDVFSWNWYILSKTEAEKEALDFGKRTGLCVVSVCPSLVFGPMLQETMNYSSSMLIKILKGEGVFENLVWRTVDVRDVADALLLVYERQEANGRYICTSHRTKVSDLAEILKKHYPNYNYLKSFIEVPESVKLNNQKLQALGWSYRPLEETLTDSVESYKQMGILE